MATRTTQDTYGMSYKQDLPGDVPKKEYTGPGMLARPEPIVSQPTASIQAPVAQTASIDSGTAFGEQTASTGISPTALASINAAGGGIQAGMASGNYSGMGAGIGSAIGTGFGPAGTAIGGAVGAVGGGLVDMFLADAAKEEQEKKARNQEKKKRKWQEYSLSLEERGRNLEDEKLQYARDDISQQRMLGAQQEMLKTKNSILQAGNLYRSRMGRNWYGPQGITPTTRGGGMATGTSAQDLGYTGKTAESTRIKAPIGMGY